MIKCSQYSYNLPSASVLQHDNDAITTFLFTNNMTATISNKEMITPAAIIPAIPGLPIPKDSNI